MQFRSICEKDYELLLASDRAVYPTDAPVTPAILDQWFQNNPEFGMVAEEGGQTRAMFIAIPLAKKAWEDLIAGRLEESDLDADTVFDNMRDSEVGIHIYHVEKYSDFSGSEPFYAAAFRQLGKIVDSLKEQNPELEVAGVSALCVTAQGIGLFYNKLNFLESDFINSEHILSKNGQLEIFDTTSQQALTAKLSDGYAYINRCKMLVAYPDGVSPVWTFL
ncbi:MAG: hypothetical protein OXR68_04395 [Alphaproteobacteria bacterium]|nr:hypothetical protein [Alphaproteobacteria bacterium]MDD9919848.1 hypothetical protein [Alphaproteobacteria bacterium]